MATNIYSDLPKIVSIISKTDAGEFGAASCPHCGADGRYIYWFICDDGTKRGAMAGCFKKFPIHEFARIQQTIIEKERDYTAKGWSLASWDTAILQAIKDFTEGNIPEWQAKQVIHNETARKQDYISRKYGRGRGR